MSALSGFHSRDADQNSPIHAIHGLRHAHLDTLSQAVARLPRPWSVDCHEGYDGDRTAIIQSADRDAARFVVSRTREGFQLALNRSDDYEKLGAFKSIDDLIAAIAARIPAVTEPTPRLPSAAAPLA